MSALSANPSAKNGRPGAKERMLHAISLAAEGKLDEAVAVLQEAVHQQPDDAKVFCQLGILLSCQGKYEAAVSAFKKASVLAQSFVPAYIGLSGALSALGSYEEALGCCEKALQYEPKNWAVLNNLGVAYKGLGRIHEAITAYERALEIRPQFADAHNNLGVALAALNKLDEAIACYSEAARIRPDFADPYYNLGLAFIRQEAWDEAVVVLKQAVGLRPQHAEAHYCLGRALREQGKPAHAARCFEEALRHRPDFAKAHWALSFAHLDRGNFQAGWEEYEWRWRSKELPPRQFQQPLWDGCCFEGKAILLHAEQGLGDTLQFIRYAPIVKQFGGTVLIECQRSLMPLLKTCAGIDQLIPAGSPLPAFAFHAPLLSLPRILKTSLLTIPADIPYLHPDSELQTKWQAVLEQYSGIKIGIAWQGNPKNRKDSGRSFPLSYFQRLTQVDGITLLSLQKGPGSEQFSDQAGNWPVVDLGSRLDESGASFLDTAAVMVNLDLVITADTAIAHLAGALGVSVWVALSYVADWRWLMQREDSPWYPSMRLFRQPERGDWGTVFDRMAEQLTQQRAKGFGKNSFRIDIGPGELIDRITILQLKLTKINDRAKFDSLRCELLALQAMADPELRRNPGLAVVASELQRVNAGLWAVEDKIRMLDQARDFGSAFVHAARSVCQLNDRRAALKRRINDLAGSPFTEEKIYARCTALSGDPVCKAVQCQTNLPQTAS